MGTGGRASAASLLLLIGLSNGRAAIAETIFSDGFESGDTMAWSLGIGEILPCPANGLSRYSHLEALSPITSCVADRIADIQTTNPTTVADVFMKVGSTTSVSSNFLHCFSGPSYTIDLDGGRDSLQATIDFFAAGNAAGSTPFERDSEAASFGRGAVWATNGDPSPLESELAALDPRLALVDFGTNDMQLGSTHRSALYPFYENMQLLLDQIEGEGVVPIIVGLHPRGDSMAAVDWVPTYDVVTRGIAEQHQVPFWSAYLATKDLPAQGLVLDGIHPNVYLPKGLAEPCIFTPDGLLFGFNARNLHTLELLDAARRIAIDGAGGQVDWQSWQGTGGPSDPIVIDSLPFTHSADTSLSPHDDVDVYPACDAQDESGPELWYRLDLDELSALRIVVLDRPGVDVDLQLMSGTPDPANCLARAHRMIETTLAAGTYYLSVDSFVSGTPQSGPYVLAVLLCESGDPECA